MEADALRQAYNPGKNEMHTDSIAIVWVDPDQLLDPATPYVQGRAANCKMRLYYCQNNVLTCQQPITYELDEAPPCYKAIL